jgi:hypothetical protein
MEFFGKEDTPDCALGWPHLFKGNLILRTREIFRSDFSHLEAAGIK